jgi:hypothetical protein
VRGELNVPGTTVKVPPGGLNSSQVSSELPFNDPLLTASMPPQTRICPASVVLTTVGSKAIAGAISRALDMLPVAVNVELDGSKISAVFTDSMKKPLSSPPRSTIFPLPLGMVTATCASRAEVISFGRVVKVLVL